MGLGRWVKLLNARSASHTRLKQYELKQILDLSEQVGQAWGGRTLGSCIQTHSICATTALEQFLRRQLLCQSCALQGACVGLPEARPCLRSRVVACCISAQGAHR